MQNTLDLGLLISNKDDFSNFLDSFKKNILSNYGIRKTNINISLKDEVISMTAGKLLINLILLQPFVEMEYDITIDDLYEYNEVNEKNLKRYFNRLIKKSTSNGEILENTKKRVCDILNEMADLSGQLNVLYGTTLSFLDFIELSVNDEEANTLFTKNNLEYGLQFNEIESRFKQSGKRLTELFKKHKESELYPYISSGAGINMKQLTQALCYVGLKPDINGDVIPVTITDNYLTGLSNIENYLINCKGTRKALITNARQVRKSGYLTRKLSLAMVNTTVDNNIEDCGSKHFVRYNITNQEKLDLINGREYHKLDSDGKRVSDELFVVNRKDPSLIGQTIGLRSPVTCACKNGICKTCYGHALAENNKNLHAGLIAVLFITNPLTQKLLSAKHLLSTSTEKINWGQDFESVFTTNMNYIYFNELQSSISINWSDIEFDEDDLAYTTTFSISQTGKKTVQFETPKDGEENIRLYLNNILLNVERDDEDTELTFNSKSFPDDTPIFSFTARNNELSKSLQQILDLIESSNHLGITKIDPFVNKFADLLIENGMNDINSVHPEIISSVLFKDEDGNKPDFTKEDVGNYEIYRVSKAIMNGPLSTALSFERLSDQFINLKTYEKDSESYTDYLFR